MVAELLAGPERDEGTERHKAARPAVKPLGVTPNLAEHELGRQGLHPAAGQGGIGCGREGRCPGRGMHFAEDCYAMDDGVFVFIAHGQEYRITIALR